MKKNSLIVSLVIIFTGLIIGGVLMFNYIQNREQKLEQQLNREQKRIALYLLNHYEGINEINFNDIEHNNTTGSKNVLLTVNNEVKMEVTFFNFDEDTENYVISWNEKLGLEEKYPATHLKSIDDIKVKYWSK